MSRRASRPTALQKLALVTSGVLAALLAVELLLRAGGAIWTGRQEARNRASLSRNAQYTVLCIGESTTAMYEGHSYPLALERILNERSSRRFRVVNHGQPGLRTEAIAQRLPFWVQRYRPDVVVAMMGINDPRGPAPADRGVAFESIAGLRVYKLFWLIWLHATTDARSPQTETVGAQATKTGDTIEKVRRRVERDPSDRDAWLLLADLHARRGRLIEAKSVATEAVKVDPGNVEAYRALYRYRKRMRDPDAAEVFVDAENRLERAIA